VYEEWNKTGIAQATYDAAKEVAGCVNGFSLLLQTTIYMVSTFRLQPKSGEVVAKKAEHETIDILYTRVTREGFMEIMVMSANESSLVDISVDITTLIDGLQRFVERGEEEAVRSAATSVISEGRYILEDIRELGRTCYPGVIPEPMRNRNKLFFDALFWLVKVTGETLVP
jgi:hypothetical protein